RQTDHKRGSGGYEHLFPPHWHRDTGPPSSRVRSAVDMSSSGKGGVGNGAEIEGNSVSPPGDVGQEVPPRIPSFVENDSESGSSAAAAAPAAVTAPPREKGEEGASGKRKSSVETV
ncbi:unnamed protein product, partial [Scytosiphon promiscuus]